MDDTESSFICLFIYSHIDQLVKQTTKTFVPVTAHSVRFDKVNLDNKFYKTGKTCRYEAIEVVIVYINM